MNTAPTIRDAVPTDLDFLVDILSDAFAEDPMFNWLFPSTRLYPAFFRMLVKDVYLPRGIVHMDEQGRAADSAQHRQGGDAYPDREHKPVLRPIHL